MAVSQEGATVGLNRDRGHHKNKEGYGPARVDVSSTNPDSIRGREEQKIAHHGGAKKRGGVSGNTVGGISPKNKKRALYIVEAIKEFGDLLKKD